MSTYTTGLSYVLGTRLCLYYVYMDIFDTNYFLSSRNGHAMFEFERDPQSMCYVKQGSHINIVKFHSSFNWAGTLNYNLSDHEAIYVTKKKNREAKTKTEFVGRSYRKYNKDILQEKLTNENWDLLFETNDPNMVWDLIIDRIEKHLNTMCPLKRIKAKYVKDPWISNDLIELILDKDKLLSKAKRTNTMEDWATAWKERNRVNKLVNKAPISLKKILTYQNKPKEFWKVIKSVLPEVMDIMAR